MRPKRIALLFGCPGLGEFYLNGVSYDLLNMRNFLLTDEGGRWSNTEIYSYYRSSQKEIMDSIHCAKADYLLCYFSGHGYHENGVQYLCADDKGFSECELISKHTKKQLIIQDTCRTIVASPELRGYIPYGDIIEQYLDAPTRLLLDQEIEKSEEGVVISYATEIGYAARDMGYGGLFTDTLLYKSRNLVASGIDYEARQIHSILHDLGELKLDHVETQNPSCRSFSGNLTVPFAFAIPKHITTEYKSVKFGFEGKGG
jgi:hypothetical protein